MHRIYSFVLSPRLLFLAPIGNSKPQQVLSGSEKATLQDYVELSKKLAHQNTSVDIFFSVPSLISDESDFNRWLQNPLADLPPSPTPYAAPPPTATASRLSVQTNLPSSRPSDSATSPRAPQKAMPSSDNSAIYGEICRLTGGTLHVFYGSFHFEDNCNRLNSVHTETRTHTDTHIPLFTVIILTFVCDNIKRKYYSQFNLSREQRRS
jgi:hypothetical protein